VAQPVLPLRESRVSKNNRSPRLASPWRAGWICARAGRAVEPHNSACSHQTYSHTGAPKGWARARWTRTRAGPAAEADSAPAGVHAKASSTRHFAGTPWDGAQVYVVAAASQHRQSRLQTGLALGVAPACSQADARGQARRGIASARTIVAHGVTHSQVLQTSQSSRAQRHRSGQLDSNTHMANMTFPLPEKGTAGTVARLQVAVSSIMPGTQSSSPPLLRALGCL